MTTQTRPLAVVALGGNAIQRAGEAGTIREQRGHAREMAARVAALVLDGWRVAITHGNGPLVGSLLLRNEAAKAEVPPMPLDVCDADSEGALGYLIQQSLHNELMRRGVRRSVVTLVTQVVVDPRDENLRRPTKPIGPFYDAVRAAALRAAGWQMIEDSGRGFRRVVPSPIPLDIVEKEALVKLVEDEVIVIAAGGGGVPVERLADGTLRGVEAVIDKDRAASLMGRLIGADRLLLLTATPDVALDFGKPTERHLSRVGVRELEEHARAGHFPPGSMGPKVEAAIEFVRGGGDSALITTAELLPRALAGEAGTLVTAQGRG